jgi:hypothetical protein
MPRAKGLQRALMKKDLISGLVNTNGRRMETILRSLELVTRRWMLVRCSIMLGIALGL